MAFCSYPKEAFRRNQLFLSHGALGKLAPAPPAAVKISSKSADHDEGMP